MMRSPLIDSDDVSIVKKHQTQEIVAIYKEVCGIDVADEFQNLTEIMEVRCNKTGLIFFTPEEITGSSHLYEQLQATGDWYYTPDKWEHRVALSAVSDCRNLMEIGCGEGSFIRSAMQKGIQAQGIEINPEGVRIAQEKGLAVELLDLKDAALQYSGHFDAVCSFQVLEHVPNPGEFLSWQLQMLRPNGKLIACVPNEDSFLRHYFEPLDYPPHHMSHWTEATFRNLEKFFPVKFVRCLKEPLDTPTAVRHWKANKAMACSRSPLGTLAFNRYTEKLFMKSIGAGFGKFFSGQCMYAEFLKIQD